MHIHELTMPCQEFGDSCVDKSYAAESRGETMRMWGHSLTARVGYLGDLVASVVLLPFAFIGILFGLIHGLCIWDFSRSSVLNSSLNLCTSKLHRTFASLLGAVITPAGAHYFRDREILSYVAGAAVITFVVSFLIHHPPNRWSIDTDGKMKFGWGF